MQDTMKIFIAILVSSLAILVNSSYQPDCGPNNHFYIYGIKESTCECLLSDAGIDCFTDRPNKICICDEGYARNAKDVCVKIAECARK